MKQVKVGIIGTGNISSTAHAPSIKSLSETSLSAVLSRDKSTGDKFISEYGDEKSVLHNSLDSFVSDSNIDLVIICSPDKKHFEQAKACLNAGKHVLLEKPITVNEKDANELVELAERQNLILATGFHLRSHVGHRLLNEVVSKGDIGNLRHIRAIWAFPQKDDSNWRAKDDLAKWWSLSAVGSHCIDMARWFASDQKDWHQFSATIANNIWKGPHDETAVISGQFESGPTVEIVSSVQFGPYNRIELFGDGGMAICDNTMGREGAGTITVNGTKLDFDPVSPFVEQLRDLVECIETGKTPRADGITGLRSVKDLLNT